MSGEINVIREEVKKYIDSADDHVVRMVYALLEADAKDDSWGEMPDDVAAELEESIRQADNGEKINHADVVKKYPQWFTK